jgi:phosphate transport system substrate-binding protein
VTLAATLVAVAALAIACGDGDEEDTTATGKTPVPQLSGSISIDGSSTVFPITEAVAEEFGKVQRNVKVTVGLSGTGGGFQKFCAGETAISDASRPITASEQTACAGKGIEYIELPVAYDALSVVVNSGNTFVSCITVAELKTMWQPAAQGTITKWNQVNPAWPDANLKLYGPGTDSGTFDYFTEHVNGKAKDSRGDFTASEDDNVLVQGVAGDRNSLGYFGLAYYLENQNKLKALQVNDKDKGCVSPSAATVENGTYPLSRPLFIYVAKSQVDKPEVKAFVDFYVKNAAMLAADVGYVKFPDRIYTQVSARWDARKVGTMYKDAPAGATLEQLLARP